MNITAQSVWDNCLSFIEDNITPQAFKTWFEPIKAVKLTDGALSIQVPSKFFYEWLEEHKTPMATKSHLQKKFLVPIEPLLMHKKLMYLLKAKTLN